MGEDTRIEDLERRITRVENGIDAIQSAVGDLKTDLAVGFATMRATTAHATQVRKEERKEEQGRPISLLDMRLRDLLILAAGFGIAGADNIMALLHALINATKGGG